jgi:addiction module RelE/StbE family toxin
MTNVRLSYEAKEDPKSIRHYFREELDNPTAAKNAVDRIINRIRQLEQFPMMGAALSSVIEPETDYCFLVSGNYLVFFRIEKTDVYVDRILYGKRDYLKILFKDLTEKENDT